MVRNGVGLPTLRLTAPADVSYGLFVHRARGRMEPLCAAPPGALKSRQVRRNGQKVPSYSTDKATLEQVLRTNARVPRVASVVAAVLEHRSLQDLVRHVFVVASAQSLPDWLTHRAMQHLRVAAQAAGPGRWPPARHVPADQGGDGPAGDG